MSGEADYVKNRRYAQKFVPPNSLNACSIARFITAPKIVSRRAPSLETLATNDYRSVIPSRRIPRRIRTVLQRFPLFPGVQDFSSGAALKFADDPVFGHEVDESGGTAVADSKCSLKE